MSIRRSTISLQTFCDYKTRSSASLCSTVPHTVPRHPATAAAGTWGPSDRGSMAVAGTWLTNGSPNRTQTCHSVIAPLSFHGGIMDSKHWTLASILLLQTTSSRVYRTAERCCSLQVRQTHSRCSLQPSHKAIAATPVMVDSAMNSRSRSIDT